MSSRTPFLLSGSNAHWGGSCVHSAPPRLSGKVTLADGRRWSERYHRSLLPLRMPRGGRAVAAPMLLVHVHVEVEPRVGGVLAVGARHRVHLVQVHGPVVVLQVGRATALLIRMV